MFIDQQVSELVHHTGNLPQSKQADALIAAARAVTPVGQYKPSAIAFFKAAAAKLNLPPAGRSALVARLERILGGGQ